MIEIESHRRDPSNNVAKVIYWLRRENLSKNVLLVQLVSPFYREHPMKKAVPLELGKVLTESTLASYKPVDFASKCSQKEFNEIYRHCAEYLEEISQLAEQSAKELVQLL